MLDALLSGTFLPPDAPEQARTVADMLASLADPGAPGALAGEATARAEFVRAASPVSISSDDRSRARPRPRRLGAILTTRFAAVLAAIAVGLGGAAVAAYANALPGPIQNFAHAAIGAPAAHHSPLHSPDFWREAAHQCAAYRQATSHGARATGKFPKLATAAGGPDKIGAYCGRVQQAVSTLSHHGIAAGHAKTKAHPTPRPYPTQKPHPTPKPHPTQKPKPSRSSHGDGGHHL